MANRWRSLDALFRIESTNLLNSKLKKSIASNLKNVAEGVEEIQSASGIPYPPYYVEPVLMVLGSRDNIGGLGVLYARTVPLETNGTVSIVIELSAPLVLYATKSALKMILAHEFLHYVELVRRFSKMDLVSQITSSSIFEDSFEDASRAIDPAKVFKEKKIVKQVKKKETQGFADDKLNERCRLRWIEKGLPVAKISAGSNQANISIESIMRTRFEPRVHELVSTIE